MALVNIIKKTLNDEITEAQIHRIADKIIGRSETSSEFEYFKGFTTEAKFPQALLTQLSHEPHINKTKSLTISSKVLFRRLELTYGKIDAKGRPNGNFKIILLWQTRKPNAAQPPIPRAR